MSLDNRKDTNEETGQHPKTPIEDLTPRMMQGQWPDTV